MAPQILDEWNFNTDIGKWMKILSDVEELTRQTQEPFPSNQIEFSTSRFMDRDKMNRVDNNSHGSRKFEAYL